MNNKNWQHNKSIKFLEFNLKKNLITQMNKTRSPKKEKRRHARTSVEIA